MNGIPKYFSLLIFGAFSLACSSIAAQKSTRPNVLIILADDLGHGDLSYTGGKTPTPNIDKIFSQGIRFNNFMTWCVCSPTRAGLLTGLHPLRTGQGPETDGTLDPNITNMGNYFQKEGYKTGLFGKWHNSPSPYKEPGATVVNKYGFDRFVGFYAGGIDYFSKGSTGWFHDDKLVEDELDYSTDLISKYAIEFMDKSKNANNPFLCYVPFNAVHTPLNVKEDVLKRVPASIREKVVKQRSMVDYQKAADSRTPPLLPYNAKKYNDDSWNEKAEALTPEEIAYLYSAVLISLDDNVGKIMDYLTKTNQIDNTIVLFFCDNGGTPDAGNNYPFGGFKHSIYEGGVHSAATMIIPKSVMATTTRDVPEMCGYLDMFPTLAELTKGKQPLPKGLDGISIVDKIKGAAKPQTDRYYYWAWRNHDVLRSDKWKMFRYWNKVVLYDLVNDIAETRDVSAENPEVVQQFKAQIDVEARKIGAAYSHLPLNIQPTKADPRGSAIAINLDMKTPADQTKQTLYLFNKSFEVLPEYYIEYDIKVDSESELTYCYLSPLKEEKPIFDGGIGVDQNGKLLQSPTKSDAGWKHVAVGLCAFSPKKFGQFGLTFKFNAVGKATVYLDNILIKNMKGEVVQEIFLDKFNQSALKSPNTSIVNL
jgi:arylsulfatase A-like enzyme